MKKEISSSLRTALALALVTFSQLASAVDLPANVSIDEDKVVASGTGCKGIESARLSGDGQVLMVMLKSEKLIFDANDKLARINCNIMANLSYDSNWQFQVTKATINVVAELDSSTNATVTQRTAIQGGSFTTASTSYSGPQKFYKYPNAVFTHEADDWSACDGGGRGLIHTFSASMDKKDTSPSTSFISFGRQKTLLILNLAWQKC